MLGNNWHKKEMPLVSLAGMGGGLSSPAFLASLILNITKPTVFSPLDDSGVPDFTYNALSSAITDVTTSSINLTGTSGSFIPGSYVKDANSTIIPSDIASVDGSTINFSSAVDLTSITAPLEMVDASGNPIAATTSNVTITTSIPGSSVATNYMFTYPNGTSVGSPHLINSAANMHPSNSMPKGDRMLWIKSDNSSNNAISDSVVLNGRVLFTDQNFNSQLFSGGIEFGERYTRLPYDVASLGTEYDHNPAYATEIGVSPGLLDIVTWTGSGTLDTNRRIPHSLGSVPGMIIVKVINGTQDWYIYHSAKGVDAYQAFNNGTAFTSGFNAWGSAPTETDFGINEDNLNTKDLNSEYVAYVFAEDTPGKVKCGTYSGNGSDNFINVGFAPNFVLIRNKDESGYPWVAANTFSMAYNKYWKPSSPDTLDGSGSDYINNNSTSIHLKGSNDKFNRAGKQYIYLAVAGSDANGLPIQSPDTTQLTFQDDTNLDQLTSGMTVTSDGPGQPIDLFSNQLYTGTSNNQTVNTGVDLLSSGGLFWLKGRNTDGDHWLYDSERGSSSHLRLLSEGASHYGSSYNVDFRNDGVQIGSNGSINYTGKNYVGWSFAKNPGFFDVVTYQGSGSNDTAIPHSLGSVPGMVIIKTINSGWDWNVLHRSLGGFDLPDNGNGTHPILYLQSGNGVALANDNWTDKYPDANNIYVNGANLNLSNEEYVAYLFADNPSNGIKCGSYQGTDYSGTVQVACGFEPQWVMIKSTGFDRWRIYWNTSSTPGSTSLTPNENWTEDGGGGVQHISFTSSGFTVENSAGYSPNWAGTFVFMAIGSPTGVGSPPTAELTADADPSTNTAIVNASSWPTGDSVTGPASIATASGFDHNIVNLTLTDSTVSKASDGSLVEGTSINQVLTVGERIQADTPVVNTVTVPVFSTTLYTSDGNPETVNNGIDLAGEGGMVWTKARTTTYNPTIFDSERGGDNGYGANTRFVIETNRTAAQQTGVQPTTFTNSGYQTSYYTANGHDFVSWTFRKAPGFFDVVTYAGDPNTAYVPQTISHNLGTVPGMMIIKSYSNNSTDWIVYHKELGATQYVLLNNVYGAGTATNVFNNTEPTDSEFTVGAFSAATNNNGNDYVAYLFADNPDNQIKCGSYVGAGYGGRLVTLGFKPHWLMIKKATDSGDWAIVDSTRGNFNELYPNNNNDEGTGKILIDFNSNGFYIDTDFNNGGVWDNNGETYIYMAIGNGEADITTQSTASGTVSASSGNIITVSDVSSSWSTGMKVRGIDSDLKDYPDAILAQDISLTSSSPTAEHTVNSWGDAVWEVATDAAFTQNVQTSSTALSASGTQSGPTFSYNSNTGYYVRTKYTALGQESAWSDTNYFVTQLAIDIDKPTILTPVNDSGVPDFDYTAESSAITNVDSQTALDDFTGITSLTGRYEYIASDPNGSVFVTGNVSAGSNYFDVSTDGGVTWSTSNTVSSWANLRPYVFVDSPTYKGFIFGSVLSGMGGDAPTYKSSQGNYLSWSQAGTLPSYQSDRGRYDAFATDNDGWVLACGSYSNVAFSSNYGNSWTRISPGSGGTTTSTPHWTAATYFAKLGKFVIATGSQSASGNKIYLSGDKTNVQNLNWTIHDSASNPPGIDDMGCNDDYLFALSGSWSGSSLWRTSDLTSWTKIADFGVTNPDKCPYNIKVKGSTIILIDSLYRGPNTGDIIVSTDGGANWIYKKINASGDTFGSFDAAIDGDNNIVAVNDRKSPRVARTKLNATTSLTLTDTTVSKVSDGNLVEGVSIDQALTVGETVQADTAISSTSTVPVFSTTLYNGAGTQDLNTGIDNTDKSLIWFKNRSYDYPHILIDTVRGFSRLSSNNSQLAHSTGIDVSSFNESGVSLWNQTGWVTNPGGHSMVAWNFRAAPGFFDIQTYTGISEGYASQSQAISHDLGSEPGMIVVKNLDSSDSWMTYHKDLADRTWIRLNTNGAKSGPLDGVFPPTQTSTEFNIGPDTSINRLNDNYVAYLFADTPGLIKCGSYTGGSTTTEINCGFRPQWLMVKSTNVSTEGDNSSWCIFDNQRGYNIGGTFYSNQVLHPNLEQDESFKSGNSSGYGGGIGFGIQFTDNGFIPKDNAHLFNDSAYPTNYIFVAIAENAEADITSDIYASGTVSASSGNTITLSDVSGTWSDGTKVQGVTTDTKDNPSVVSAKSVSFTSSEPSAPQTLPAGQSWDTATWQIATDENFTQNVQTATTALSETGSQTGPSFTLEKETGYYTRTKYTALGQESEWSDASYFITGPSVYVDDVFSTHLYTGNGTTQTIANGIDLAGEGGMVWIKNREKGGSPTAWASNYLFDTARNPDNSGNMEFLITNNSGGSGGTNTDTTKDFGGWVSNGFMLGQPYSMGGDALNGAGDDFVSWTFRKAPGFFDIVTWTGTNDGTRIPHNLGSLPGMIIVKNLDSGENWRVYAKKEMWIDGETYAYYRLSLNSSNQRSETVANIANTDTFNPQSMASEAYGVNYIAYLFADGDARFGANEDESIIKCGTYTGGGNSETTVDLGFEPQWVMIKRLTGSDSGGWAIYDNMRGVVTGTSSGDMQLLANESTYETDQNRIDFYSQGFKLQNDADPTNHSGYQYAYMAIRRPHKPVTSSSEVFAVNTWGGTAPNPPALGAGFPIDMAFHKIITSNNGPWEWSSRLTAGKVLGSHTDSNESTDSQFKFDYQTGAHDSGSIFSNHYSWLFKRAPGFFDVVAYTGTGSTQEVKHNLGVAPELIIVKRRSSDANWTVYSEPTGNRNYMNLNHDYAAFDPGYGQYWNNTSPTSSVFTVNSAAEVNANTATYVAFLFATQPGVSKVGSYTASGAGAQAIDCGFTNGAAFLLIKNIGSGDWYLLDSERGINAYNQTEPYLTLNTKNQEQTANMVGYKNTGFMVNGSSPLNNGTYIFLAIANP